MPETTTEILPCPVCGKPCRLTAALVGTSFYVLCGTECAYSGTRGNLIDATIAAHNAIASAVADRDRLAAEVEALKAQDGRLFVAARMQQDGEQLCAVANMTAGLANVPARVPCTGAPRTMHCATDAPADGAARSLVGTVTGPMAGEARPASPADGESFDLGYVAAEVRDDARDYLLRHDLAWIEPCPICDADMERVDCPDCEGAGVGWFTGARGDREERFEGDCDRCAATGWLMRCTGCLAYDDDPRVIAAERRALGLTDGEVTP